MRTPGWAAVRVRPSSQAPVKRTDILAVALLTCSIITALATATYGAWLPIIEDSADVHLTVSSLTLDTTHFGSPTLLVGTYRDSNGLSLVMTVDPLTLEPMDTVYRSTYIPKVCRAADLNMDSHLDFLVSLTSVAGDSARFSSVVVIYGPDFQTADTLSLPRTAIDLVVDEAKQEFWLGYRHDTTIVEYFGCTDYTRQYVGFGGAFSYELNQTRFLDEDRAGIAFTLADVNSDSEPDLVALWLISGSYWTSGCGPAPYYTWSATGVWQRDGVGDEITVQDWIRFYNQWEYYDDIQPYVQLPVADFNRDGLFEAVLSWQHRRLFAGWPTEMHLYVEVVSLTSGQPLWTRTLPSTGSGYAFNGPYTAILYDIDQSAPPEVLLIGTATTAEGPYTIYALCGDNGDSLFTTEFRNVSGLNVVHSFAPGEPSRVIHASTNWLYRWRIGLGTSADDGSELVIPDKFLLRTNSPNPFNAETRISYTLAYSMAIDLSVYDALGRRVTKLVDSHQAGGGHTVIWNGRNNAGHKAPSGVYFLRLAAGGEQLVRKMALVK